MVRDARVISDWQIRVDGHRPHHLTVLSQDPYSTTFVSCGPPHGAQSELLSERRRYVGEGMREDLRLRNLSTRPMRTRTRHEIAGGPHDTTDSYLSRRTR
ncbi:glycogen debranching N-terminal domain-containing protein [Streptomyces hirsutus]|uniref:glycogen debranching N-terminal domain-containing protein n=1 Tax=Streptomyces hirsutus TaxID=35620 RepID=UPI0036C38B0D